MPSPTTVNIQLDKAIGKFHDILKMFFGPRLIRLNAKANAEAKLISARASIDEKKLLAQGKAELKAQKAALQRVAEQVDADELIDVIWEVPEIIEEPGPFETVEQRRLKNVKYLTAEVMKVLPEHVEGRDVSEAAVDPDWFARYFESVKDVSNEILRKHWARLLAGEVHLAVFR